ncbi:hypothetical protein SAMN05444581_12121 [Methylocapsa palsarum]|uniref:Uncharacterized protein n=1 Tax=Methylocapsa palsarum TaxID=1612308 RepID=A0A1I4CFU4_9HYPH|nr:hypothetical protein SAMN05444581_12121 [Methylocapsa palsarum]
MSEAQPRGLGMPAAVIRLPLTPAGRDVLLEALRAPGGLRGIYGLETGDWLDWDAIAEYAAEIERDLERDREIDLEIERRRRS